MAEGSSPGIILASKFVSPGSEKYAAYIDYIDRDEAMRGTGYLRYTAYVDDYMDNPAKQKERFGFDPRTEKMTAIFTANKDRLTPAEKRELKKQFALAQKNESPLWQHVLSFDNKWLADNGILDQETTSVNEQQLRAATRAAMKELMKQEHMENSAIWSADIHYNTDNLHVHIAMVEPHPTRKKVRVGDHEEYRGKLKPQTLDRAKQKALGVLADRTAEYAQINAFRNSSAQRIRSHAFDLDPKLRDDFLKLYHALPTNRSHWQYGWNEMKPLRPLIDQISARYLATYCPKEFADYRQALLDQQQFIRSALGDGKRLEWQNYPDRKMADLFKRLGNAVLTTARSYDERLSQQHPDRAEIVPSAKPVSHGRAALSSAMLSLRHGLGAELMRERQRNHAAFKKLQQELTGDPQRDSEYPMES